MGLDRAIRIPPDTTPAWAAIRAQLARVGESGPLRMIDGLPAFPDEEPPTDWRELRVGTDAGMVTIRREPARLRCVIWGNADPALASAWARVVWACAEACGGVVETESGELPAGEFARASGLSPA